MKACQCLAAVLASLGTLLGGVAAVFAARKGKGSRRKKR
ncbi:hypothetical protein SAMN05421543_1237 [Alicyclobacillus macrosporangiidus]|uniref:Uncharacterized protein n=1 Tax=Alicyclobacillus macrosporangiidus TaxID=392015 RepID=A0A1I7L1I6_9BACL|nr:hypothetical protein SAMN05421543_1237 [Alicyclobacillus macrosporangiidus]